MKQPLKIMIALLLLVSVVLLVFVFLKKDSGTPEEQPPANPFPENPGKVTDPPEAVGENPNIEAILARPETTALGSGSYVLNEDKTIASPYSITYYEPDNSYSVVLYRNPLGVAREAAEAEFLSILGIDRESVCALRVRIHVGAPLNISSDYGAQELGLSFCPGAVPLPEQ